jgi:hypothetical protein
VQGEVGSGASAAGVDPVLIGAVDGAGNAQLFHVANGVADNTNGAALAAAAAYLFNGLTFDRARGNVDINTPVINLAAVGPGTYTGATQTNYNGRGVQLCIEIASVTGGGSFTVSIIGIVPTTSATYNIISSGAIPGAGTGVLTVYPGAAVVANQSASTPLPRTWAVVVVVTGVGTLVTLRCDASVIV